MTKPPTVTTLSVCVAGALEDLAMLAEELREWYDNMPENFQNGEKGAEVDDAASALENVEGINIPDHLEGLRVTYLITRRARSRADRRDDVVVSLMACTQALDERIREQTEAREDPSQNQDVRDAIQGVIDEAESVDFPGR